MGNCPPQHTRHKPFCETIANDLMRDYQDAATEEEAMQFMLRRACPCYDGFNEEELKQCTDPTWKCNGGNHNEILQNHPECKGWIEYVNRIMVAPDSGSAEAQEEPQDDSNNDSGRQTMDEDKKLNDMDSGRQMMQVMEEPGSGRQVMQVVEKPGSGRQTMDENN